MAGRISRYWDAFLHRRSLRRWMRKSKGAAAADLATLRTWRGQARALRRNMDIVNHEADHRLALPVIGSDVFPRQLGTDWWWRPFAWKGPSPLPGIASVSGKTAFCEGISVFHDCRKADLILRQIRNTREVEIAPFGLRMDVFGFDGSFLSLVLDLPEDVTRGLKQRHLIRLDAIVEMERPLKVFARLNIKHGPNVDQIVRELPPNSEPVMVEFDLAYSKMNENRIERLWVDLIFEDPAMNEVTLRDVIFSRRPRAEL
ncbi:MAG: DUF6478 family protein [Alphaproteobacteria bacterium]